MRHADQVAFLERMLVMLRTDTREDGPGLSHAPAESYFDPARYRREIDVLFRRHPIVAGPSALVARPGDRVSLNATDQPILLERGDDGVLRAFLDPGHRRLKLAEKYGLIWVVPTALEDHEDAALDIDAYLGPMQPDLASWTMEGWERHSVQPIRKNVNWKLAMDTFLESYHSRYLHASTVFPLFLDNIVTYQQMGRHIRGSAAKRTLADLEGQPREDWRILDRAIVVYSIFPNTVLTYSQDHCAMVSCFPVASEQTELHFSVLISPQERARKTEIYWKATRRLFSSALTQDLTIGETIQRNLHSGANRQQTFGKFEKALGWYHAEIDRALRAP
jgi:phenylpropionate dioxygenase-like ring-hydroxylating dioxygenase large terminal subunit